MSELSERVVIFSPPACSAQYNRNSSHPRNTAYLAALILAHDKKPSSVAALSAQELQPWVRLLLFAGHWAGEGRLRALLGVAIQHHQYEVRRQIIQQHDYWQQVSSEEHGYSELNEFLRVVPDELLCRLALRHVITFTWRPQFTQEVFRQLLELRFYSAELFRKALFAQIITGPEPTLHRLTLAAVRLTLFETEPTVEWWYYWQQAVRFGPALMQPLLESVGEWRRPLHAAGIASLTDTQLAEVLRWLVQELHVREENGADDYRTENPSSRVRAFRNNVAGLLANRATKEALETLSSLAEKLGYPSWLAYMLEEARETHSRIEWHPLPTADLLALCRKSSQRWIQGGEDLLEAIIESLDRLQERMQGEPASAAFLWYPAAPSDVSRVRDGNKVVNENVVSSFVQRFLIDDLPKQIPPVHREVQLRVPTNPGTGQDVDLYVTATARDKHGELILTDVVTVLIEAKHNDNDVTTSLTDQLVNRYLQNHPSKFGLFLAYWHTAETGQSMSKGSISELRKELARQAQVASKDGLLVKSYVLDIRLPEHL